MSLSANHFTCTCLFFLVFLCVVVVRLDSSGHAQTTATCTKPEGESATVRACETKEEKWDKSQAFRSFYIVVIPSLAVSVLGSPLRCYIRSFFFVLLFFLHQFSRLFIQTPAPFFFFFLSPCLSRDSLFIIIFFLLWAFFFLIFLFYVHLYALRGHFLRWATRSWMPRHTLTQLFWSKLAPWAFRKLAKFLLVLFIGTVAAVLFCFFVQKLSLFCFLSLSSLSIQEN